jgi:hypothetical protein
MFETYFLYIVEAAIIGVGGYALTWLMSYFGTANAINAMKDTTVIGINSVNHTAITGMNAVLAAHNLSSVVAASETGLQNDTTPPTK